MEKEMSGDCVDQWSEQSTGNRKTWARIPAQSKTSFFPQKDFKFCKLIKKTETVEFSKYV